MELLHVFAPRLAREVTSQDAEGRKRALIFGIVGLILFRGVVAGLTPLSYDEAYYWLWSKHLAAAYYDHPSLVAYVIRAGTTLFGDTSLGVRFVPWLLSIAASWAVWRSAWLILGGEYAASLAVLLFNLMPMIAVESLVATPDAPEIAATAVLVFALVKVAQTGSGPWWIAVGFAAGFALLSKYTALFLGGSILVWLVMTPKERHWFLSPWPYLGAALALLMFLPVVVWNAEHNWISFAKQFGRVDTGGFTLRFLGDFLGGQLGLATPFIAVLSIVGTYTIFVRDRARSELALPLALIAPVFLYFMWHALHDRVQGNWPSFLYPVIAIAAAAAWLKLDTRRPTLLLRISKGLAVPLAATMVVLIYAQALWGVIPRVRDPVSRLLAVGMDEVVDAIERLRMQTGARAVVTTSYALTGWFSFYLPSHPPVVQLNERLRYLDEPEPDRSLFEGPLLYVTEVRNDQSASLAMRFAHVMPLGHIKRVRNGATIDEYAAYSVSGLQGKPFD